MAGTLDYLSGLQFGAPANGVGVNADKLNPEFSNRIAALIRDAVAATGDNSVHINEGFRAPERQAQLRADYLGKPVTYGGKTYAPAKPGTSSGYKAAAPGKSRHQSGAAVDVYAGSKPGKVNDGAAWDWMLSHLGDYGLQQTDPRNDPAHIELTNADYRLVQAGKAPSTWKLPNRPPGLLPETRVATAVDAVNAMAGDRGNSALSYADLPAPPPLLNSIVPQSYLDKLYSTSATPNTNANRPLSGAEALTQMPATPTYKGLAPLTKNPQTLSPPNLPLNPPKAPASIPAPLVASTNPFTKPALPVPKLALPVPPKAPAPVAKPDPMAAYMSNYYGSYGAAPAMPAPPKVAPPSVTTSVATFDPLAALRGAGQQALSFLGDKGGEALNAAGGAVQGLGTGIANTADAAKDAVIKALASTVAGRSLVINPMIGAIGKSGRVPLGDNQVSALRYNHDTGEFERYIRSAALAGTVPRPVTAVASNLSVTPPRIPTAPVKAPVKKPLSQSAGYLAAVANNSSLMS